MKLSKLAVIGVARKMKLSKVAEVGAAVGTATLVGLNALRHERKESKRRAEEHKKSLFRSDRIALGMSLIAAGLALWDMKKHHDHHLAA